MYFLLLSFCEWRIQVWLSWSFCSRSHKTVIKVSVKLQSFLELGVFFQDPMFWAEFSSLKLHKWRFHFFFLTVSQWSPSTARGQPQVLARWLPLTCRFIFQDQQKNLPEFRKSSSSSFKRLTWLGWTHPRYSPFWLTQSTYYGS